MLKIVFAVMQGTAEPVPDMMLINLLIVRNIDNATRTVPDSVAY